MRRIIGSFPSTMVLALSALGLTGCPLRDHYYVEKDGATNGGAGVGGATDSGGADATGGTAGKTSGSAGSSATCANLDCAADCCSATCTDLSTDSANCGSCGKSCSEHQVCAAGSCHGWTSMAAAPATFVARRGAAYASMGGRLFIFGGLDEGGNALGDAAIYDPVQDSWSLVTADANTPSARQLSSAIWTGKKVVIVGGTVGIATPPLMGVASYNPTTGAWASHFPLDTPRVAPSVAYDVSSSQLLVWGGYTASGAAIAGGEYFASDTSDGTAIAYLSCSFSNCVSVAINDPSWVDTGSGAYLFGGRWNGTTASQNTYSYGTASHQWTSIGTNSIATPSARSGAFGVWDGTSFFVWGGESDNGLLADGSRYAPTGFGWTMLTATSLLSPRWAPHRRTGWGVALGLGNVAFLGGLNSAGSVLTDGARYVQNIDEWTTIGSWPSGEAHEYGVVVAIDGEVFLWGGLNGSTVTATGERWVP